MVLVSLVLGVFFIGRHQGIDFQWSGRLIVVGDF